MRRLGRRRIGVRLWTLCSGRQFAEFALAVVRRLAPGRLERAAELACAVRLCVAFGKVSGEPAQQAVVMDKWQVTDTIFQLLAGIGHWSEQCHLQRVGAHDVARVGHVGALDAAVLFLVSWRLRAGQLRHYSSVCSIAR